MFGLLRYELYSYDQCVLKDYYNKNDMNEVEDQEPHERFGKFTAPKHLMAETIKMLKRKEKDQHDLNERFLSIQNGILSKAKGIQSAHDISRKKEAMMEGVRAFKDAEQKTSGSNWGRRSLTPAALAAGPKRNPLSKP